MFSRLVIRSTNNKGSSYLLGSISGPWGHRRITETANHLTSPNPATGISHLRHEARFWGKQSDLPDRRRRFRVWTSLLHGFEACDWSNSHRIHGICLGKNHGPHKIIDRFSKQYSDVIWVMVLLNIFDFFNQMTKAIWGGFPCFFQHLLLGWQKMVGFHDVSLLSTPTNESPLLRKPSFPFERAPCYGTCSWFFGGEYLSLGYLVQPRG